MSLSPPLTPVQTPTTPMSERSEVQLTLVNPLPVLPPAATPCQKNVEDTMHHARQARESIRSSREAMRSLRQEARLAMQEAKALRRQMGGLLSQSMMDDFYPPF